LNGVALNAVSIDDGVGTFTIADRTA